MNTESRFLFDRLPHLIDEWDFYKNKDIELNLITYGSKKKYWWICPKCESSYDDSAESKGLGRNCPYCAGKRVNHTNSLASLRPDLAEQWHERLNGELTQHDITLKSNKKYWWYCKECESDYDMPAIHKSRDIGCPYCSGRRVLKEKSLAVLRPDLIKEWDFEKNVKDPYETSPNSHQKAHWKCELGHEWEAVVKSRNLVGAKCPYCSSRKVLAGYNDLWTTNSELAKLLANPEDGYRFMQWSKDSVDWKCSDCQIIIKNKKIRDINSDGLSCPRCSDGISMCEKIMYNFLSQLNVDIETQKTFNWSESRRYDFYIPSLNMIIETHGLQHYSGSGFSTFGGRTLEEEKLNDQLKEKLAKENSISNYIVIDCRRSKFDFIKNSITGSELANYFDLSSINWALVEEASSKSLKVEANKMWKSGIRDMSYIAKVLRVHKNTVKNYIS